MDSNKRRIITGLAAAALMITTAGCGSNSPADNSSTNTETSVTAATTSATSAQESAPPADESLPETELSADSPADTEAPKAVSAPPVELAPGSAVFTDIHPLSEIDLSTERTWINDDPRYADLIDLLALDHSGPVSKKVYLAANDEDILCFEAADEYEIDGATKFNAFTTFEIASISKTFTATAILQLIEHGQLSLDDRLENFFPEFVNGKDITVSQLLHMQAGLYDYGKEDPVNYEKLYGPAADEAEIYHKLYSADTTEEEVLQAIFRSELKYEPGTRSEYCNTNYHLLAYIIEQASGMTYSEYMQKNIFDVCGLGHTSAAAVGDVTSVPCLSGSQASLVDENGHTVNPGYLKGAGDMHSCAADLLAFDRALMNGKLINEDSLAEMFNMDKGYGCGIEGKTAGSYYHSGGITGYSSLNRIMTTANGQHVYFIELTHT